MIGCIAVDDEPAALGIMTNHIEKTPFLQLKGAFLNALEAMDFLNNHSVDLIFLDINMPDLNGLDLLRSLQTPPLVVFTTAHRKYALDGFQVDAVDYLLKPITFAHFLKAANKVRDRMSIRPQSAPAPSPPVASSDGFIFVKVDQMMVRLDFADIEVIEGNRDYLTIYTQDGGKLLTLQTLTQILEKLPDWFVRAHRSFIVNLSRIKAMDKNHIQLGGREVPIGKSYREALMTKLSDLS